MPSEIPASRPSAPVASINRNSAKITDAREKATEYVYEDGVLTTVKLPPNEASGTEVRRVAMIYDVVGRIIEVLRDIVRDRPIKAT